MFPSGDFGEFQDTAFRVSAGEKGKTSFHQVIAGERLPAAGTEHHGDGGVFGGNPVENAVKPAQVVGLVNLKIKLASSVATLITVFPPVCAKADRHTTAVRQAVRVIFPMT
ncbi:hypothetical protein Barb7_03275 [Bacteroidales bacterium Barb7]|nr:hypothetical protein Barb7_03275 [Bacteroidales bacterium Barb7]